MIALATKLCTECKKDEKPYEVVFNGMVGRAVCKKCYDKLMTASPSAIFTAKTKKKFLSAFDKGRSSNKKKL